MVQSRLLLDTLVHALLGSTETLRVLLRRLLVRARATELRLRFGLRTLCGAGSLLGLHLADAERTQSFSHPYPVSLTLLEVLNARRAVFQALPLALTLCIERPLGPFTFLAGGAGRGGARLALSRGQALLSRPFFYALPADPEERGERIATGHARQRSARISAGRRRALAAEWMRRSARLAAADRG